MSKAKFAKEFADVPTAGIRDPIIHYVEINGQRYIVGGNNRLRAAIRFDKTDDIVFERVDLPYKGFKTEKDVLTSAAEAAR